MRRGLSWFVILGSLNLLALACSQDQAEPVAHDISYVLDWNTDGVVFGDSGLTLTNNLGIDVRVEAAYLVVYSTQMVACETNDSILGQFFNWLMPRAH